MAMGKKDRGGSLGMLLVLLLILAGVGTWNYRRNVEAEAVQPRPYRSYTDAQLADLRAAYEEQTGRLEKRYDAAAARRSRSRDVHLLGEAVEAFESVQRSSRATRELGARLSQEQASLRAIEEEQALRARMGGPAMTFLKRVFLPPM